MQQVIAGQTQHRRQGQIGLPDQTLAVDQAITDRRLVIEFDIAGLAGLEFLLHPAQLLVLHFQLDLVQLQILQQLLQILRPHGIRRRSSAAAQGGFRQTPQGPGIGNVDQIAVIDNLEWFHLDSFTVAARSVLAIA